MKEWKIIAYNGRKHIATWTYDVMKDAKRAWSHIDRKKTTIDTGEPVSAARLLMPNGDIYYPDESVRWR